MPETTPDLARALELAERLAAATAGAAPWTPAEQLVVAQALLSTATVERKALERAARLLDDLADREVLRPDLIGTYTRIAADIRALKRKTG
jgi:hypothetical protein